MFETDPERQSGRYRQMDNTSLEPNDRNNATPVAWVAPSSSSSNMNNNKTTKSNNAFPIQLDISHPLWQTFLDSGTRSPLAFFRVFLSPPTYFHSPTPWTRSTR